MFGVSYDGLTSAMTLLHPHPALKAISEQASPADQWMNDDDHRYGALRESYAFEYAVYEQADKNANTHFNFETYDTYSWYLDLGPLSNINAKYLHDRCRAFNRCCCVGRAAHRRPLLRRHTRLHGRPHRARGRARRSDRGRQGRRHDHDRRAEAGASTSNLSDDEIAERLRGYEPPPASFTRRRDGQVRQAGGERLRGRRHALRSTPARAWRVRADALDAVLGARSPAMKPASSWLNRVRALDHRQVPGVLEHDAARVLADQTLELVGVLDRDQDVVAAPDDQRRDLDPRRAGRGTSSDSSARRRPSLKPGEPPPRASSVASGTDSRSG